MANGYRGYRSIHPARDRTLEEDALRHNALGRALVDGI